MKLNYEQVKNIATGAEIIEESREGFCFSRFTAEQNVLYKNRNEDCYLRSLSTSGIKLSFKTDSKTLFMKVKTSPGSSRKYFSVDVFVNDESVGSINNFSFCTMPQKYVGVELALGEYEKNFELWSGMKVVTVYLPWSVDTVIEEISIDDGAVIQPVKRSKTLLAFGDSITQGYDALQSSMTYVARLARALDADETNKGIGGEMFFPELAASEEGFVPDYVTVAYGVNDWSHRPRAEFEENCRGFFRELSRNYPNSKKFVITPIWVACCAETRPTGKFDELDGIIRACIEDESIKVISGIDLVPHEPELFADLEVHPTDKGFEHYFENLFKNIK